ncbi:MAG: YhgE/Pip domain-containing protein [Clostridiales bacterium]|nr:YhgE/Pip domain-containing protein [Candidatus Crickella merdequi]
MNWTVIKEIFIRDVKRLIHNWVAVVVVIGIIILPALYAWFNIGANMDPYSKSGNIKVGVVCEDKGATSRQTGDINIGERIIDNLKKNDKLGWEFTSATEADKGIKSGKYYATITIPETFSKDMISFLDGNIGKPTVEYRVNEKKNAIAPKVTGTGATTLQRQINEIFMKTVSETVTEALGEFASTATSELGNAEATAIKDLNEAQAIIGGYQSLISKSHKTIAADQALLSDAQTTVKKAQGDNAAVGSVLAENDTLLADIRANIETLPAGPARSILDQVYDRANGANGRLKSINAMMGPELVRMNTSIGSLKSALKSLDKTLTTTSKAMDLTSKQIDSIKATIGIISGSQIIKDLSRLSGMNADEISEFMKEPITIKSEVFYSVRNYGSGMTPFYTMLAIWVGGIILLAIFKLEVDSEDIEGDITPQTAYLGRWLLYVVVGIAQGIVVCLGDLLIPGVQCEHPILFMIVGIIASIVFVTTIYALATTFRHIGKALVIILVIMQIPGSAGTYPIEMTGAFFRVIHPLLPFTYGINAMRETIAGTYGTLFVRNLLMLILFFLIAMFIGLVLRLAVLNLNRMLDIKLGETGLMEIEAIGEEYPYEKLRKIKSFIAEDEEVAERIRERRERFEANYEMRAKQGVTLLIAVPTILMFFMFVSRHKLISLTVWITTTIIIAIILLNMEFVHMKNQDIEGGEQHD